MAGAVYRTVFEFTLSSTGCAAGGSLSYYIDPHTSTASATKDFDAVSGTITFATGNLDDQPLPVPVVADLESEPDEQFYVCLKAPTVTGTLPVPLMVTTSYGTGTIVNDDVQPRYRSALRADPSPKNSPVTTDELHCSR